jgi:hypothetical protein
MFELADDLRTSMRGLLRWPAYPIVAVIILALVLSAAMVVGTYVHGFYRPFPGVFEANWLVRVFGVEDDEAPDVAVVNQALARRFFAGENPLGRQLNWPEEGRSFEIVGVVRDTKTQDFFTEPPPTVFFAYPQLGYGPTSTLTVSVNGDPLRSVPSLYRWLRDFEPFLAIINTASPRRRTGDSTWRTTARGRSTPSTSSRPRIHGMNRPYQDGYVLRRS